MNKQKQVRSVLNLNIKRLVKMVGFGYINGPIRYFGHDITPKGYAKVVPALGGLVYDYVLGDSVDKYEADHLQPGASISANQSFMPEDDENKALFTYACLGNEVVITDNYSDAKGAKGIVIGKHGGVNYIMAQFPKGTLKKITHTDEIRIELCGIGIKDLSHPGIHFMNVDPSVLVRIPIKEFKIDTIGGKQNVTGLSFPVVKIIPAEAMGSGLGSTEVTGDYDIMSTHDSAKDLKIGDFVAVKDHYSYIAPGYLRNAITIGVIIHGGCLDSGHGPGILPIATCDRTPDLKIHIDLKSNLKRYI